MVVETFSAFEPGEVVAGQLPGGGAVSTPLFEDFVLSVTNYGEGPHSLIIFDSSNPSRADLDLGTPHHSCGGLGVGAGGRAGERGENCEPLGNLLIVAENLIDANGDGIVDVPDDEGGGGVVVFRFVSPTRLDSVTLVDVDRENVYLELHTTTSEVVTVWASDLGDNSVQTLSLSEYPTVDRLDVQFGGSGAIARMIYEVEQPLPVLPMTWGQVKHAYLP